MLEQIVKTLVEQFCIPFQADGGDLKYVSCEGNKVKVQIVIGPETCRDCIMAPEDVKEVLGGSIEAQYGRPVEVEIEVVEME